MLYQTIFVAFILKFFWQGTNCFAEYVPSGWEIDDLETATQHYDQTNELYKNLKLRATPPSTYVNRSHINFSAFPQTENVYAVAKLYEHLFKTTGPNNTRMHTQYLSRTAPIVNGSRVNIELDTFTVDLLDFEIETQSLSIVLWGCMVWYDPRLSWNEEDFDGIRTIEFDPTEIWIPDLTLYNSADGNVLPNLMSQPWGNIFSNGNVHWCPVLSLKVYCPMKMYYFPFDHQTCMVKMGSWRYTQDRLEWHFIKNKTRLSHFQGSNTWSLIDTMQFTNAMRYPFGTWQDLKIFYTFKRNPNQYVINVVITCMALCALSAFSFFVPCSSGERLGLCLSVVISISVYQLVAMDVIPRGTETTPFLSLFLTIQLFLVFIAVACTMFQLNIYCQKQIIPPNRTYFNCLLFIGRMLLMEKNKNNCPAWAAYAKQKDKIDGLMKHQLNEKNESWTDKNQSSVLTEEDLEETSEIEWDLAAAIIDRMCFVIYAIVLASSGIWLIAYQNHDHVQRKKALDDVFGPDGRAYA